MGHGDSQRHEGAGSCRPRISSPSYRGIVEELQADTRPVPGDGGGAGGILLPGVSGPQRSCENSPQRQSGTERGGSSVEGVTQEGTSGLRIARPQSGRYCVPGECGDTRGSAGGRPDLYAEAPVVRQALGRRASRPGGGPGEGLDMAKPPAGDRPAGKEDLL